MLEVQSSEFKSRLASFLEKAKHGETIVITHYGEEIAHLIPAKNRRQKEIDEAIDNIKQFGKKVGARNKDLTIEDIISSIHEGHKY